MTTKSRKRIDNSVKVYNSEKGITIHGLKDVKQRRVERRKTNKYANDKKVSREMAIEAIDYLLSS